MQEELGIEKIIEVVIAVTDVEKAATSFHDLFGVKFELEWEVPRENVKVKAATVLGTQLQLIQSTNPEGVIAKFIQARGEGLNHIAFKVSNLKEMVSRLKEKGVKFTSEEPIEIKNPVFNPVGEGLVDYIFIHPKSAHGTLIELIETKG